jgi:STAS-like domain of unknown function (DUF4325)
MSDVLLSIARDFGPSPAGRRPQDGPFNAQRFRDELLVPAIERAIRQNGRVIVDFADADSYSSSFLEEVFGGLIRGRRFPPSVIRHVLQLKSDDPVYAAYVIDAKDYLSSELAKVAA